MQHALDIEMLYGWLEPGNYRLEFDIVDENYEVTDSIFAIFMGG